MQALLRADPGAAVALVYTGVSLTLLEYFFLPPTVEGWLRELPPHAQPPPSLSAGLIWSAATCIGYLAVPLSLVKLRGDSLASIGFSFSGLRRHLWVYLALYAVMLPGILWAAERESFLSTYPFVTSARADVRDFCIWEPAYLIQFFALEAFFRGYLLFTLEKSIGALSIFVMAVPYCMIHYHKPLPEALGAIIAGLVLGALALRYRSFYGGALLHALVAATMDCLAVQRNGLFR